VSVVVKETQADIYYTVIITTLIFLVGGYTPVGRRPPGLRFGLPSVPAGVGLGFAGPIRVRQSWGAHLAMRRPDYFL